MTRLFLIVALLLAPAVARADDSQTIALLLKAHGKLELYGQPVATEVARALEKSGYTIIVVTSTSSVPSKARLVIDGRIVRGQGDAVLIEAIVRDPIKGITLDELTATAPALTRIDEAADDLATRLVPILRAGLDGQKRDTRPTVSRDDAGDPPTGTVKKKRARDRRPLALVSMGTQVVPRRDDPVPEPLLRAGAVRLARILGHRSEDLRGTSGEDLAGELGKRSAALAVHVELLTIHYRDRGVVTARARARVRITGPDGTLFDRVVRTDTLVGGRGDRRDAVARAAVDQIVDIAAPRIRETLAAQAKP